MNIKILFLANIILMFFVINFALSNDEFNIENKFTALKKKAEKIENGYASMNPDYMPEKISENMKLLGSNSNGYNEFLYVPDGSVMIFIPKGNFIMGSNAGLKDSMPQRDIYLDSFYIDKFEVTNEQFQRLLIKFNIKKSKFSPGQPMEPAVNYSREIVTKCFKKISKYLPTEAQWEKACRGIDKRVFPWGNTPVNKNNVWKANILANGRMEKAGQDGFYRIAPVGNYPQGKSFYGALDMAGNVWEWCKDVYSEKAYTLFKSKNPFNKGGLNVNNQFIVMRGGAFSHPYHFCKSYSRSRSSQRLKSGGTIGFRMVFKP